MLYCTVCVVVFKEETAYELRISDWGSDVCSADLSAIHFKLGDDASRKGARIVHRHKGSQFSTFKRFTNTGRTIRGDDGQATDQGFVQGIAGPFPPLRTDEHVRLAHDREWVCLIIAEINTVGQMPLSTEDPKTGK